MVAGVWIGILLVVVERIRVRDVKICVRPMPGMVAGVWIGILLVVVERIRVRAVRGRPPLANIVNRDLFLFALRIRGFFAVRQVGLDGAHLNVADLCL